MPARHGLRSNRPRVMRITLLGRGGASNQVSTGNRTGAQVPGAGLVCAKSPTQDARTKMGALLIIMAIKSDKA